MAGENDCWESVMTNPNDAVSPVNPNVEWAHPDYFGLTKREYFAIRIMQGFCSYESKETQTMDIKDWEKKWAKTSLRIADALIAALNEPKN